MIFHHHASHFAVTAWELDNLLLCSDADHLRAAFHSALRWHRDMLSAISRPYQAGRLQLGLRYIFDPEEKPAPLRILLVVKVKATGKEDAVLLSRELNEDLETFLQPVVGGPGVPYQWGRITDKGRLEKLMEGPADINKRMFLNDTHVYEDRSGNSLHLPPLLPSAQYADNWAFVQHHQVNSTLFHAMLHEEEYVEVHLQLMPYALPEGTEELLQHILADTLPPRDTHHAQWLRQSLESYLKSKERLYLTLVELYRKSSGVDNALNAAICDAFLSGHANAHVVDKYTSNEYTLLTDKLSEDRLLGQIATPNSVLYNWCLPTPVGQDSGAFPCLSRAMRLEPQHRITAGVAIGRHGRGITAMPVRIAESDMMRHLYIMGQTGTGKTTMLKTMIHDRLHNGDGLAVIDPHGDLYDHVLNIIPAGRAADVVRFDPMDQDHRPSFNPLIYDHQRFPRQKTVIIDDLIRSFAFRWDMSMAGGPVFEELFSVVMRLNMDDAVCKEFGIATLTRFCRIFYDKEMRTKMIGICGDQGVVRYIENAHRMQGEYSWENFGPYITSKVRKLVDDDIFRDIINAEATLDMRNIMDSRKILLVNLEKGYVGSDNVVYFGRILLSALFRHAISRADIPPSERMPFYLFIDEFQNFSTGDIGSAMSEVRKYRLSLILANQTLGQLPDETVQSLLGNVGSQAFFRPGPLDYQRIAPFLMRHFSDNEILSMPNFYAATRLLYKDRPMEPFVTETYPEGHTTATADIPSRSFSEQYANN